MSNEKQYRKELLLMRANAEAVIMSVDRQLEALAAQERKDGKPVKKESKKYLEGAARARAQMRKRYATN